jgi:hypothetical protein
MNGPVTEAIRQKARADNNEELRNRLEKVILDAQNHLKANNINAATQRLSEGVKL